MSSWSSRYGSYYAVSAGKKVVEKHSGRSIMSGAIIITLYRLPDKGFRGPLYSKHL